VLQACITFARPIEFQPNHDAVVMPDPAFDIDRTIFCTVEDPVVKVKLLRIMQGHA